MKLKGNVSSIAALFAVLLLIALPLILLFMDLTFKDPEVGFAVIVWACLGFLCGIIAYEKN